MIARKRLSQDFVSSLLTGVTSQNPLAAVSPGEILTTSVIRLRVLDVAPYEHNPRRATNEKIDEIKESIRARGLDQMFAVTKRPGSAQYITAKGGCTRLAALQALAQEELNSEIPAEKQVWQETDFLLVKYQRDSDLRVGHLTENIHRSDMIFWDIASGILELKDSLEEERSAKYSRQQFAVQLKEMGFNIAETALSDYEFAVTTLRSLSEPIRRSIGRNDIRNEGGLRPTFNALQALWVKHEERNTRTFTEAFARWVSKYTHPDFDIKTFREFLTAKMADELGYSSVQIEGMLAALKVNKEATLADLIAPAPNASSSQAASTETSSSAKAQDEDTELAGAEASAQTGSAAASNSDVPDPGLDDSDSFLPTAPVSLANSQKGFSVASGLTPIVRQDTAATRKANQDGSTHAPEQSNDLGQLSVQVRDAIVALAQMAGIQHLLVDAPSMPYMFMIDLPAPGVLGDNMDDLAVQAWWLLANVSAQCPLDDPSSIINAVDAQGQAVLPDTGPDGYRAVFGDPSRWIEVVGTSLGQATATEMSFLLAVLTHPNHPLTAPALAMLPVLQRFNEAASRH